MGSKGIRYGFLLKLVAELAVIVAGVLIAFAVDAWWERVQNQELEKQVLQSLADELAEVSESASALIERNDQIIEQAQQVTQENTAQLKELSILQIAKLFASVPYDLRLRTYDELNSTGQFHVLSDREFRLLLTEFDAQAKALLGYERQMQIQWNETARPILYRLISFDAVGAPFEEQSSQRSEHLLRSELGDEDVMELRNVIIDRANFSIVHRLLLQRTIPLITELRDRAGAALTSE